MTIQTTPINRTGSTLKMAKITVLVVCLIAICIEFQEISACLHEPAPCEKVFSCKTDEECNGGQCQGISSNWPYTGKCYCGRRAARIGNMKGRYLMENLFTPENLYKIAGAVHKEIHGAIDAINRKDQMYQQTKGNPIYQIETKESKA